MIELYKSVNKATPSQDMIDTMIETNKLNCIDIDRNHACSILKLVMSKEHAQNLKEKNRFWSIVDVYRTVPREQLYDTVSGLINPYNYGTNLKK